MIGFVGSVTDISDRKQAEAERLKAEQIRQELTLLEKILNTVLAGYWDWDIPNRHEYLSPGFKQMFGYADHELSNTPESWQTLSTQRTYPRYGSVSSAMFRAEAKFLTITRFDIAIRMVRRSGPSVPVR